MSFRDVTIKIPDRGCDQGCDDITHQKHGLRFEKSQLVEFLPRKKVGGFRFLAEALRWVPHVMGGRWKTQHRKIVPLSLCRKTF